MKLKLGRQPFRILTILLRHAGQVVTRDELQKEVWPHTTVDFDHSLNKAINTIREVLGDSAESPRYIETLPRRGYRFVAPVVHDGDDARILAKEVPLQLPPIDGEVARPEQLADAVAKPPFESRDRRWVFAGAALLGAAALGATLWRLPIPANSLPRVVGFRQLTQDGQGKGFMTTDGSRIYFNEVMPGSVAFQGPFQVAVKGGEVTRFASQIKQPVLLDLSPDATEILIRSDADNSLWIQPTAGGSPKPVTRGVGFAGFGPGAKSILYGVDRSVYSVRLDGLSPQRLFSLAEGTFPFYFRLSPDGKTFRFSRMNQQNGTNEIMEASTDGTGLHSVLSGSCGEWTRDGLYFVFNGRVPGEIALQTRPGIKTFSWRQTEEPTALTAGPLEFQYPLPARDGKEIYAVGTTHRAEVMRYDSRIGEFVPFLAAISAQGTCFLQGRSVGHLLFLSRRLFVAQQNRRQ